MDLVKIEDDEIVIRIKIDTIPIAFQCLFDYYQQFIIIDNEQFAKDIVYELNREEENGDTMLYDILDKAVGRAIDQGSLGVDLVASPD